MVTAFAMIAPTLAICGFEMGQVWRISSGLMLATLVPWLVSYPFRRNRAAPDESLPVRWYVMNTIGLGVTAFLILNLFGWLVVPGPGPLALATVFVLAYATVAYIGTYSLFTEG